MDQSREAQGARLETLIKALGESQLSFSKAIDASQSNVSFIISGKRPVINLLRKITARYKDVNPAWIVFGVGQMFKDDKIESVEEPTILYQSSQEGIFENLVRKVEQLEERVKALEKK